MLLPLRSILLPALAVLALAAPVLAAEPAVPPFAAGDSVCFIGDSITHGGGYHANITLFYATRFPAARFAGYNCGLSGDSAAGALKRFDYDIAAHRPTVATVMLGMNDVNRGLYGTDKTGEADLKKQQGSLDWHARNMDQLFARLQALKCRIILLTPSIYDQTGNQKTDNLFGVNDALGRCAVLGRELAAKYQGTVVDFHGPMTRINAEGQARDPAFTIVGGDRVHPGETGHLVMAFLVLKAQGMGPCVSAIAIDAGKLASSERCTVSEFKAGADSLAFTCLEQSLPFPVADGARKALELVPLVDDLDRQLLTVRGLAPGSYELLIDGIPVHEAAAEAWAQGVNLALNPKTPQYQQALAVKKLNDHRHTLVSQRLRTIAAIWHFTLSQVPGLKEDDFAGAEKVLQERLEKTKAAKNQYGAWQIETYLQYKPKQAEVEREVVETTDALWKAAAPRPHQWQLRRKG
ncbi:MAG: SGNH/GDSL hydrolase family protein [Planctomycetes bacterium]|nr:SGNH/GDSL hydrolase family protein [Planctomycetota bacterium]